MQVGKAAWVFQVASLQAWQVNHYWCLAQLRGSKGESKMKALFVLVWPVPEWEVLVAQGEEVDGLPLTVTLQAVQERGWRFPMSVHWVLEFPMHDVVLGVQNVARRTWYCVWPK